MFRGKDVHEMAPATPKTRQKAALGSTPARATESRN
jgi:hypothetical protein